MVESYLQMGEAHIPNSTNVLMLEYQATDSGHLNDICTVYEIHSGQMTSSEGKKHGWMCNRYQYSLLNTLAEFHSISGHVVLEALKLLEQQGKASLIEAETVDETGVKFIEL